MKGKMQGVTLIADWDPKPGFKLGCKGYRRPPDLPGQPGVAQPALRDPRIRYPHPGTGRSADGSQSLRHLRLGCPHGTGGQGWLYLLSGLTGFPSILGHEFSGVVVEAGKNARDKRTNKPFKGGEAVTSEEMLWCGQCKPCADGQPNHCEQLDEVGFNVNGAYTKYIVLPARTIWSLEPLRKNYKGDDIFVAGSLVEPTCVAYNAVIERGGGIRPGDRVVILGAGPVGIAACAILKRAGASKVIISETQQERADMALKLGADYHVNPAKEDFADRVLEITDGMGADMFMEATGLPDVVYPGIERVIWEGRTLLQHGGGHRPGRGQDAGHRRSAAGAQGAHRRRAGTFRAWQLPARHRVHGLRHGYDPDEHQEDQPGRAAGEYHQAADRPLGVQDHLYRQLGSS